MLKLNTVPKALWLVPIVLLAVHPRAAQAAGKTGVVNVQTVVASIPGGEGFVALSKKSDADLQVQQKTIQALLSKARARGATAADKSAYTTAAKAYQTTVQKYGKDLATLFAPLATRVNTAVASVAKASGYAVVLDQRSAREQGIVIYANAQATDMTAAVVAKVKLGK
jgi:outer membrane protein